MASSQELDLGADLVELLVELGNLPLGHFVRVQLSALIQDRKP